jgi:hypothetical protein
MRAVQGVISEGEETECSDDIGPIMRCIKSSLNLKSDLSDRRLCGRGRFTTKFAVGDNLISLYTE